MWALILYAFIGCFYQDTFIGCFYLDVFIWMFLSRRFYLDGFLFMRPSYIVRHSFFVDTSNAVCGNFSHFVRCMYKLAISNVYPHMTVKPVFLAVFSDRLFPKDYVSGSWRFCSNIILIFFHIGYSFKNYAFGSDLPVYLIY